MAFLRFTKAGHFFKNMSWVFGILICVIAMTGIGIVIYLCGEFKKFEDEDWRDDD